MKKIINEVAEVPVDFRPAVEASYPEPVDFNPPKRGRGRPKGSKNKVREVIAEPTAVLTSSVAEEVMRKIAEKRAETERITKEAERALREGTALEEKKRMEKELEESAKAKGPWMKKETPPISEELKEKTEGDFSTPSEAGKITEALIEEKEEAKKAAELIQKKKLFKEREELARGRRVAAVAEAQKLQEKMEKRGQVEEIKGVIPSTFIPEGQKAVKAEEIAKVRKKYEDFHNLYSAGEREKLLKRGPEEQPAIETPKKQGGWLEKIKAGWNKFWTEGRK